MREKYKRDFLDDVIDAVEENLSYDGVCNHSDNCEIFGYIPYNGNYGITRKDVKKLLINILGDKCLCEKINQLKDEMMVSEL